MPALWKASGTVRLDAPLPAKRASRLRALLGLLGHHVKQAKPEAGGWLRHHGASRRTLLFGGLLLLAVVHGFVGTVVGKAAAR